MPGFIGRRLCPELVFVKPDFSKYVKIAAATRAIFVDYDPDFEAGSLDEAYLDVTDYCQMHTTTGVCEVLQGRVYAMPTLGMCPFRCLYACCDTKAHCRAGVSSMCGSCSDATAPMVMSAFTIRLNHLLRQKPTYAAIGN